MAPHESNRPIPLSKELWASLIQYVRSALMMAQRRTPDAGECKQAEEAVEALEAIESLTPERCLHCAIRDMLVAHADAHGQDMLDTARASGWNPHDPAHANAQTLIFRARIVALGTMAGELAIEHRSHNTSPWDVQMQGTWDCLMRAFVDALEEGQGCTPPAESMQPTSSPVPNFVDMLRPPKSKLH